jgi:Phosphotransferase enzyme family
VASRRDRAVCLVLTVIFRGDPTRPHGRKRSSIDNKIGASVMIEFIGNHMEEQAVFREWTKNHLRVDVPLKVEALRGNSYLTEGVWRVSDDRGAVIVKAMSDDRPQVGDPWIDHWSYRCQDEAHWNYWKREYLAYRSEFIAYFSDRGVLSPAILNSIETPARVVLVMEDCQLVPGASWDSGSYCLAAYKLGVVQGSLEGEGLEDPAWFCKNYLTDYAAEKPFDRRMITAVDKWADLVAVGILSTDTRDRIVKFALGEERLLSLLSTVPSTVCHNDFWTNNLFGDSAQGVTAIDWSFIGRGPMGSDIANLVASAGFDGFVPASGLLDFGDEVCDAYMAGICDSGWQGDMRLVRVGYLASVCKYTWVVAAMLASWRTPDHPTYVGYGDSGGVDFRAIAATLDGLAQWSMRAVTM